MIVLSAINIYTHGPLVVARKALSGILESPTVRKGNERVIFFCHSRALYSDISHPALEYVEIPRSRRHWLNRLFYEYVWFWFWSRRRQINVWISLHDITPNVVARRRVVYCHNSTPFYDGPHDWRELKFELFRAFYARLYRINLFRNDYVIVQQQWIRDRFVQMFSFDTSRIIVARP